MSANDLARKEAQHHEEMPPPILEELLDMRVSKRCLWPEITAYYHELTGQSIEAGTLRRIMLREAPIQSVPAQVSYEISRTIRQTWKSLDTHQPLFDAVNAKFIEWRLLNDQLNAAAPQGDGGESSEESFHDLDRLKNDLARLFFELAASTKDSTDSGTALDQLAALTGSGTEREDSSGRMTRKELEEYMNKMGAESEAKLKEIHRQHREEARGIYRPFPESYDDNVEEE